MDDIIEFANENLEGEIDSDILNYGPDQNRAFSVSSIRGWEVTGISHLLNSSSEPAAEKMNSESEHREDDFPSSSSSLSHVLSSSDDSVAPSGSGNRLSRRKRSRTDPLNKKPRIDYKNPFHADRLTNAISAVITALRGDPLGFHKNITSIAKTHDIPYNTLRDNVLRARGIEPRAHRNSERKRQAEAVAAALERGVEYKVPKSHLQIQTERVSVHIGDALEMDPEPRILYPSCRIEDNIFSLPPLELPLPHIEEDFKIDLDIKVKAEIKSDIEFRGDILDCCNQVNGGDSDDNILNTFPIDF